MPLRTMFQASILQEPHTQAAFFARHPVRRGAVAAAPGGAGFDFPTQLVGATPDGNVTVYYDPSLGQPGLDIAQALLARASQTYSDTQAFFNVPGQPVNVIVAAINGQTDGSGGAYHYGCSFNPGGDLYCDVAFGNLDLTNGLVVAELTESFMGAQGLGWDCGGSNGEALSRVLAELLSGGPDGALAAYATGPAWDQAGRPNWIDANEPTDRNPVSTGCGVVYLYWMISQGFSAAQITQAGCTDGSLASNYNALTGNTTAWSDFIAAVDALPGGINSDNPWGQAPQARARKSSAIQISLDPVARTITLPAGWRLV